MTLKNHILKIISRSAVKTTVVLFKVFFFIYSFFSQKEISKFSNYNFGIEKANNVVLSTLKIVVNKSNSLLDGLKYKNQPYYSTVNNTNSMFAASSSTILTDPSCSLTGNSSDWSQTHPFPIISSTVDCVLDTGQPLIIQETSSKRSSSSLTPTAYNQQQPQQSHEMSLNQTSRNQSFQGAVSFTLPNSNRAKDTDLGNAK